MHGARIRKAAVGIIGRQIRKGWRHRGVELNRGWGFGYEVVEAVVEAIVGTTLVGTIDGLASMITVRVLVAVLPQVSVARPGDRTSGNGQFDCGSRAGWKMSGPARTLGGWETRSTDALRR
jgi:hypothetical protein